LQGGNAARNFGFEISKGEYVQWFDSDDIMVPTKLEVKIRALVESNSDFAVCEHADLNNINEVKKKRLIKKEGDTLLNHLRGEVWFQTNGPMFRRSFLEGITLFDETILFGQDWEFFTRLLIKKPHIYYIHTVLFYLRSSKEGIRGGRSRTKLLSRIQAELNLFMVINKSKYFKNTTYEYSYNRFLFNRLIKRYKFFKSIGSNKATLRYLIEMIKIINITFYYKSFWRLWKTSSF